MVGYGPHRLANHVATAGAGVNHYFLINPVRSDTAKRGRADEITRLADLPVEIDGYKNGHASVETVCDFAIELSQRIGAVPVGIVESDGGWHLHWAAAGARSARTSPSRRPKNCCWAGGRWPGRLTPRGGYLHRSQIVSQRLSQCDARLFSLGQIRQLRWRDNSEKTVAR